MMKLKNNKGFTLIEIILVFAILSLVLGMIGSFFVYGLNVFTAGDSQYNAQSQLRIASEYLVENIRFSNSLNLVDKPANPENPTTLDGEYDYIYVENGVLYHFISDGSTHSLKKITDNITNYEFTSNINFLKINLFSEDRDQEYNIETEVDLPNLTIKKEVIENNSGAAIKFLSSGNFSYTSYNLEIIPDELIFDGLSESKNLSYSITPQLSGHTSKWISDDETIAIVSGNNENTNIVNIDSTGYGNTFIMVNIKKDNVDMSVSIPVLVLDDETTVVISPEGPIDVAVNGTQQLDFDSTLRSGDSIKKEEWSSSNPTYATVNNSGLVEIFEAGSDKSVTIYLEIETEYGNYAQDNVQINIIALKVKTPKIKAEKDKGVVKITLTEGTPESTVEFYKNNQLLKTEVLDLNGSLYVEFKNQAPDKLMLSKDGYESTDFITID